MWGFTLKKLQLGWDLPCRQTPNAAYKLTDSELVQMVLNPENEDSKDSDIEKNEEKIPNARCIELTKKLLSKGWSRNIS